MTAAQETHQRAHRACNIGVRTSEAGRLEAVLPFICECNRAACCATVWLPVAEYDEARAYALPILARHHSALDDEPPAAADEWSGADLLDALRPDWLHTGALLSAA